MTIQRYRDEYSGCEPDAEGEFVKFDDVFELITKARAEEDGSGSSEYDAGVTDMYFAVRKLMGIDV